MGEGAVARLARLHALVDADLESVEDLLRRLDHVCSAISEAPSDAERMAVAGYVHHAYTGMEAALERIIREIEGALPAGSRSHRDLLESVRVAIPSVRSAVIGPSTYDRLSRYLSFRHAYRHGYAMRLDWERLEPLVRDLPATLLALRTDLRAFFGGAGSAGTKAGAAQ